MPVSPLQVFFFFFLRGEVILHFFRFGSDFGPVFFFFSGLVSFPGFWKTIRVLQIRKN